MTVLKKYSWEVTHITTVMAVIVAAMLVTHLFGGGTSKTTPPIPQTHIPSSSALTPQPSNAVQSPPQRETAPLSNPTPAKSQGVPVATPETRTLHSASLRA